PGGVPETDEQLPVAGVLEHRIEPPLAAVLPGYHRARRLCLLFHAKDVHDLQVMGRLVTLETSVAYPVGADREVREPTEVAPVGIVAVTHPHAQIAGALDDEEAQRAAGEHRGFTLDIGGEIERCDRLSVVRHAGTGSGDEAHLVAGQHERAGGAGERGIVEDQRIRGVTAETVLALLEPEESRERQPAGVAGEPADAPGAPRSDAGALGLQIRGPGGDARGRAAREQHRSELQHCRGAKARAPIPVHRASSVQAFPWLHFTPSGLAPEDLLAHVRHLAGTRGPRPFAALGARAAVAARTDDARGLRERVPDPGDVEYLGHGVEHLRSRLRNTRFPAPVQALPQDRIDHWFARHAV